MNNTVYYHFLSSRNAIHDIERQMIRVSTLDTLNDPFELMPYLRYKRGEDIKQYMKIRDEISGLYGLLCFSGTCNEPLLWSHYADRHKGIALGFNFDMNNVIKVIYSNNPIREQIELTDNFIINKNRFLDLAKIKYKKWEHEDEYRMLVDLKNCIRIDGHYFYRFGNNLKIREIRLGAKFDYKVNDIKYILNMSTITSNIDVIPCRLERQGYKITKDGYRGNKFKRIQGNIKYR